MGGDYDMKVATRIVGFVSGILTIVLGFIHIINVKAHIEWPSHFIDDVNRLHWRILFTFQPGVIGVMWSPLIWGIVAVLVHAASFQCSMITKTFLHFFIFNFLKGLFVDIGYAGGLGIIFSIVTWITCAMCLYCWIRCDDTASLELKMGSCLQKK